jgi:HD-like signal output (HDOD) protein
MSQIAEKVSRDIITAINRDQLILPTLPEIALRVREMADDPKADLNNLAAVIANDAALSARLIRVANSPLLRAGREVDNLVDALMRLGMDYACNIATGLAMEQLFQATSDLVDMRMREVWYSSSEVAGISHVLCKHYTSLRPDLATLAGLVHKIGVLPILTYAEDNPALLRDSLTLDRVIEEIHAPIGGLILKAWNFPEVLHPVPAEHLQFQREVPYADYVDLVTVAVLHNQLFSESFITRVDFDSVKAFERLGLDPNIDITESSDLAADLDDARSLLE